MVTLLLDSAHFEVVLSITERAMCFRRENIRINREHISKVQLIDDPWTWLRGFRSPGLFVPKVMAAGTWRSAAGVDFVMVRGKKPGVVIDLVAESEFQRIVLTTRHGLALAKALRLDDVADVPHDVVTLTSPIPTVSPRRTTRPATA